MASSLPACVREKLSFKKAFVKCVNQTEALVYNPSELCSWSRTASLFVSAEELQLSRMTRSH